MPRYRVTHKISGETWEVEMPFSDDARRVVGWPVTDCWIVLMREGSYAEMPPPKVAVQIKPPEVGRAHICPDCNVTMMDKHDQEFLWQCPSCDLFYHEWENQFYKPDELDI